MYLYLDVTVFQQELLDSFNVLNSAFPFKLTVMWGVGDQTRARGSRSEYVVLEYRRKPFLIGKKM